MEINILQKFIDSSGKYLVGQKYNKGWRNNSDTWNTVFLSFSVPTELFGKKVNDLPYSEVKKLNDTETPANIYAGKSYTPFQYGVRLGNFISLEEVTCDFNELIHKCYEDNITDYIEVIKLMKSMTAKNIKE